MLDLATIRNYWFFNKTMMNIVCYKDGSRFKLNKIIKTAKI